ncbi:hypothetical protein Taro_002651 [Colocasia esculenta]|uniref:CCHC-type domain-containing protein n=1 Tax=Colocasia esculenta TaxID=4460 RepID=A0A843TH55_COLES|nr:hypothetical protein [Colocasia esculenta]
MWGSSWRLGEQEIAHTKLFFFPVASAATCTDSHLEVNQREKVVLATFQFTKDARAWWKATSAHLPNVGELECVGFLEIFRGKYFSERVKEKKAMEFAALKQKGMSVAEYDTQFACLAVYAPHLVGTERLKANRFMDGLRPMFIEKLGPHNIQTYTEMVQRAQLVEDTMAKVEGIKGKDISKPTSIKRGSVDTTGTFHNNNNNNHYNNNKRPTTGKGYGMEKKIKVEETMMAEYCNFCNKPGHQADKCWKKSEACLRCGSHEHRIPNCPMLKDQVGRNQGVVKRQGRVKAITQAELPEGGVLGGWGSRRSPTPSRSSSPLRLLRPTQIVILKLTKGPQGLKPGGCTLPPGEECSHSTGEGDLGQKYIK